MPPALPLVAALTAVYLAWGGTYLAMAVAVRSIPPFLVSGLRFVTAGALLFAVLALRGRWRASAAQWRGAALAGVFLLVGGNGVVCCLAHLVPSGVVALIIACTTLFVVLISWCWGGAPPTQRVALGIVVGLAGVSLLVWHPGEAAPWPWWAPLGLLGACASWGLGTVLARRLAQPADPWLATAAQMVTGGSVSLGLATLTGEWSRFTPAAITTASWWAWAYLIVIGAIVGFGAYQWLLRHASPALATSYGYVNPLVALALGAVLNGEALTQQTLLAGAIIVGAVVLLAFAPTNDRKD